MSQKPVFIVSDLHLGSVSRDTDAAFRAFLRHVRAEGSGLVINGDLFDFWFEYRTVVHSAHVRVVAALADLVEDGIPVWFVGGNHDWWTGDFLRGEIGLSVLDGPAELELAGRRAWVAHGDGVGRGDRGYRLLRWFLRGRLTVWGFRQLHPDWGSRVAGWVSTTEHKVGIDARSVAHRADAVREWAAEVLEREPSVELVVAGHVHSPEVTELEPGRFYVNAGDWINHFSYVTVPYGDGPPMLHRWRHPQG